MALDIRQQQEKALKLRERIPKIANDIITESDFSKYLDLVINLNYLEYYNQILIFQQYPNARLVAGYPSWEKYFPEGQNIRKINTNWRGLDILMPFRLGSNIKDAQLTWITVKVYDIAQIDIKNLRLPPSSYIPRDERHQNLLCKSLNAVITNQFNMRVVYELPPKTDSEKNYLPGIITRFTVTVRNNLTDFEELLWLVEALSEIYFRSVAKGNEPEEYELLFSRCFCYLLLRRWHIKHAEIYLPNKALLKSLDQKWQCSFLKLLQKGYRTMEENLQSVYHFYRFGVIDNLDDFSLS